MKTHSLLLFLFVTPGWWGCVLDARVVEAIDVHYTKEQINGKVFEYRFNLVNGEVKEYWLVDSKEVSADTYEDILLQAELAQRRKEREEKLAHKKMLYERKARSRMLAQRQLLQEYSRDLEQKVALLDEYNLHNFIVFNDSCTQEQFNELVDATLPRIRRLLADDMSLSVCSELDELIDKIEPLAPTIQLVFHDTLDQATHMCKDTRKLKKLLELTAHL